MCPRRQQRGTLKGRWGNLFATSDIQKFSELCWGKDGYGRTNHAHRTMHILDVISSVSRSLKMHQNRWRLGLCPRPPLKELTALPLTPYMGLKEPTCKAPTAKERGERQNDLCSQVQETLVPQLFWRRSSLTGASKTEPNYPVNNEETYTTVEANYKHTHKQNPVEGSLGFCTIRLDNREGLSIAPGVFITYKQSLKCK